MITKLKLLFLFLLLPLLSFSQNKNRNANDSLEYRVYCGVTMPYTYYAQDGFFHIGVSIKNNRNEFVTKFLFAGTPEGKNMDMLRGVSLEYFNQFKSPYRRLKFGSIAQYSQGKFYYSWGNGSSISEREFKTHGIYIGPAASITAIKIKKFNLDFLYHTGILYAKRGLYFVSLSCNMSYQF